MADNSRKVSTLEDVHMTAEKRNTTNTIDKQSRKASDLDEMADSPENTSQIEDVVMKMEKDDSSVEEEFKKPLRPASMDSEEDIKRIGEKKEDKLAKASSTKRRPHSKSRRGCITCKRRRVKCDETHPMCKNCEHLGLECSFTNQAKPQQESIGSNRPLNMIDLRLFYHYTSQGWRTITEAGIHGDEIWGRDVPMLAFNFPFLMHAILTFSATHLSRTHSGVVPENVVTVHRGDALNLLRQEVKEVTPSNLDALVAASILLILDSLANASSPDATDPSSLPASAWLHHVRGAATILISVQPLPPESRFNELVNIDLQDLAEIQPVAEGMQLLGVSGLECFDEDLRDLYPVSTTSPYFQTLMFLDKLYHQQNKSDFILRVFSFPALIDKSFIELLVKNDKTTRRIIKVYYKLVREFAQRNKESVWFLEGVAKVLPIDMDSEFGGLGFITSALPVQPAMLSLDKALEGFDAGILAAMQEVSNSIGEETLGSGMQYFHES